jgi:diaminopimelate epimerase
MKEVRFVKMQGNGNDFIIIDEFKKITIKEKRNFAMHACDRRFGIGADGVLFLLKSSVADVKMELFQPDGSEAEMCGNGVRCLVTYAVNSGYIPRGKVTIETKAGVLEVKAKKGSVVVDMGEPKFARRDIPAKGAESHFIENMYGHVVSAVNVGVPHAVIFVDDLDIDLLDVAPKIRFDPVFPHGANVDFVKVDGNTLLVRTYERGVEFETLSCGTGAVASAVVANQIGLVGSVVNVKTRGGALKIALKDGRAFMEGPAKTVFKGMYYMSTH